ncbi:VapB-type antitoxin, partial [Sulfolobus sp. A20-N-F8]
GNFFIGIPIPKDPILFSSNVIKSERDTIKLRNDAEINMKREIEENADRH